MAASKNKAQTNLSIDQFLARLGPYQREIAGAMTLFISIITLLSLLSLSEGTVSGWWADFFRQLFGWGAIPAASLLGALGALLTFSRLRDETKPLPFDIIVAIEVLLIVGLALTHLLAVEPGEYAVRLAREGSGGGFVGWGVSNFVVELVGDGAAIILLFIIGLAALGVMARFSFADAAQWTELINRWAQQRLEDQDRDTLVDAVEPSPEAPSKKSSKTASPKAKPPKPPAPEMTAELALTTLPHTQRALPPISLLAPPVKDAGQGANARYQAQIIEETLGGFGIPGEVVEINSGPTVTQFGLKLGTIERKLPDGATIQQRIRVNKVLALSNDLALALSASPIRIEAPVPGRPLVGIEVPNTDKTMVSLRGVIESDDFQKSTKPLLVALGKGVSGQAVSASLVDTPHLLIAGATGSGKSVCINTLISTLLFTHAPEQLRFLMIDPKMVELTSYNGIPHLIAPVVTDFDQVVGALAWATREMERRYKLFAAAGARSISGYNRKVGAKGERLPFLVIVIDELADLMMMAPDEVERHICRIAQMARATGIHLVIATQRPSVDVVTGLIKANFPTRIAFAVTSQIDSRVILDTPGAERLLGKGDMLYMASDSAKLRRLQGCFVSDAEINNVVKFWRASIGIAPNETVEKVSDEDLPWADIVANADKDDLLQEAVKLVMDSNRASTSLLQRRLGIGYPRASRLMDQLEEEGVIGPADGSRPREVLWRDDRDEADYDEFEQDVKGGAVEG
ncbi:MAG: DNA translocase FtsK [Anaerolineaceae bacterium]|nr:DNA translocase FtsK [Anaerolineaceae bacterium]MCB9099433.1 DNA translocase FtsK [Anaerolineales bacterium]